MLDLALIATVLVLSLITLIYMAGCDLLMRTDTSRDEGFRT